MKGGFIPVTKAELKGEADFILISGDAYVDHPSFGTALIGRYLQRLGYSVGIIAQPDWRSSSDFTRLGRPRLAFLCAAGNVDSMVNHYTAAKKRRSGDYYSPGGKAGLRPDRSTIVYTNRIKEAFPGVPVIIAGVEASLRRFAHYDYWDDAVRRSMLVDSGADMLIYGMAERAVKETARRLKSGESPSQMTGIAGTCRYCAEKPGSALEIAPFEEVKADKLAYAKCFAVITKNQDPVKGKALAQRHGDGYLVAEKPAMPLSRAELDDLATLPYLRNWHPMYNKAGGVPALEEVKFSITMSRGCFGGCAFCAITMHQGRIVQSRSPESVEKEARLLAKMPDFKGYIHDIGGPTANFTRPSCDNQLKNGVCANRRCLTPKPCPNLAVDHGDSLEAMRRVRAVPGVKKAFVRSGVRYDYAMLDKSGAYIRELCRHHVSGQLKIAPEHVASNVLKAMGKPDANVYKAFKAEFDRANASAGLEQYTVPYFMSSHPGCDIKSAVELAEYMRDNRIRPEQAQDFYPTPGTLATCMYHTGFDPLSMKPVFVPKSFEEKAMQRALLQYSRPQNHALARKALIACGRADLIGYGKKCLVPPEKAGAKYIKRGDSPANGATNGKNKADDSRRKLSKNGGGRRKNNT